MSSYTDTTSSPPPGLMADFFGSALKRIASGASLVDPKIPVDPGGTLDVYPNYLDAPRLC